MRGSFKFSPNSNSERGTINLSVTSTRSPMKGGRSTFVLSAHIGSPPKQLARRIDIPVHAGLQRIGQFMTNTGSRESHQMHSVIEVTVHLERWESLFLPPVQVSVVTKVYSEPDCGHEISIHQTSRVREFAHLPAAAVTCA